MGGEQTYASVILDYTIGRLAILAVTMTLSLTQMVLFATSRGSWYISGLYVCANISSLSLWKFLSPLQSAERYPQLTQNTELQISECGNNISPLVFCEGSTMTVDNSLLSGAMMASSATLAYMLLQAFRSWKLSQNKIERVSIQISSLTGDQRRRKSVTTANNTMRWCVHFLNRIPSPPLLLLLGLIYCGASAFYMYIFIKTAIFMVNMQRSTQWSMGQIIALAVWLPVVCKFLYTLLCKSSNHPRNCRYDAPRLTLSLVGVENNAKVRMPNQYTTTKPGPSNDSNSKEFDTSESNFSNCSTVRAARRRCVSRQVSTPIPTNDEDFEMLVPGCHIRTI